MPQERPRGHARACIVMGMDEDRPIAYTVLGGGVPVLGSDGEQVGTVHHVVAAPEKDIFHGIVVATGGFGRRFVEAATWRASTKAEWT